MKKLIALIMALAMVLSLAACGGGGGGGADGDTLQVTWWIGTGEDATYYPSYDDNPAVKYMETTEYNGRKIDFKFVTPVSGAELDAMDIAEAEVNTPASWIWPSPTPPLRSFWRTASSMT